MATGLSPVVAWGLRIPADGRGALWLTIGALGWALTDTMVKLLGRDIHPVALTAALTSSVATAWLWTTPAWTQIPVMIAMGLLSTFAMTCVVRGLSVGAVSVAAAIGDMLFGEIPDGRTLAGASVIVAAALHVGRSATQRPRGGG